MASPTVDPQRVQRALHLRVVRTIGTSWRVSGGAVDHVVQMIDGRMVCDCRDVLNRPRACKHMVACVLSRLPGSVLDALRQLVPAPVLASRRSAPRASTAGVGRSGLVA